MSQDFLGVIFGSPIIHDAVSLLPAVGSTNGPCSLLQVNTVAIETAGHIALLAPVPRCHLSF